MHLLWKKRICIYSIRANQFLSTGKVNMVINVKPNGLDYNLLKLVLILSISEPKIEIVDGVFIEWK